MELFPEQLAAKTAVLQWMESTEDRPIFYLAGSAGTGKTTIAQDLASGVTTGQVLFAAPTGKATKVLSNKGCSPCSTIHSLAYVPRIKCRQHLANLQEEFRLAPDEDKKRELRVLIARESENLRRPLFSLNTESQVRNSALLVLDEVSMLDVRTVEDLLSFGTRILALGDPKQLPPVGGAGFFTKREPDFLLTQIHRQAGDNPILELAYAAAGGAVLPFGEYGASRVVPRGILKIEDLAAHDQIIVGRNATRRVINDLYRREVLRHTNPLPVAGERLVCLRNDYDSGLTNGSQILVHACEVLDADLMLLHVSDPDAADPYVFGIKAFRHHIEGRENDIPPYMMREAQLVDYAYAVTCHKAQGSEWDSVVVVDESGAFRQDARRWLYTAITRASERVTVIQ